MPNWAASLLIKGQNRYSIHIAKNSLIYFSAQVIGKGMYFLTTIYLARKLGAAEYGKFGFAFGLVTIFSVLSKFGLDILTSRDVGEDNSRASLYFSGGLILRVLLSFVMIAALAVISRFFDKPADVNALVLLLGCAIALQSWAAASTSLFEAFQLFPFRSFLSICMYGFIFLSVVVAFRHSVNVVAAGWAFVIGSSVYTLIAFVLCNWKITKFHIQWDNTFTDFLRTLFSKALPLGLADVFIGIYYRADAVILSMMHANQVVGWYEAAYAFVYGLRLLPVTFALVLLPSLARIYSTDQKRAFSIFAKATRLSAVAGIALTTIVALGARPLVQLCYGSEYAPSAGVLPLLIWTCAIMFVTGLEGMFLIVCGKRNAFFRATAAGAVSNLILNLLLIPKWNMYGAAVATVASEFVVFIVCTKNILKLMPLTFFIRGQSESKDDFA
jgi:O-antigen/teichoic acid export membrane protein